ncbi:MAG: hypothetical protein ACI9Y1_001311 [Lentisphaeria bacterium]
MTYKKEYFPPENAPFVYVDFIAVTALAAAHLLAVTAIKLEFKKHSSKTKT